VSSKEKFWERSFRRCKKIYYSNEIICCSPNRVISIFEDTAHHKQRHIYFTWGTCAVGAVFLIVHILWMFGSWHEIEWGTGGTKVPVTFSWESGASLLYASLVVGLYIVHINVKNGVWYSIIPGISDTDAFHKAHHTGTEETGPVSKEASVVFAVSFFLLIMGLLGDT
jgi:hypothetical protein